MKQHFRISTLAILMVLAMCCANAAEYSAADNVPSTTSLLFTPSTIAITVDPYANVGYEDNERTLYFLMDRSEVEFRQISRDRFAMLAAGEHVRERTHIRYHNPRDHKVTYSHDCADRGYRYDAGPQGLTGRRTIQFDSVVFEVRMLCRSSIADAIIHDNDLWIASYEQGGHGEYGSEGVLVVSNTGAPLSRIDVGHYPVENLIKDPWSSDIWVVTSSQLTVVSGPKTVKSRYWKYHDFDLTLNRPEVFVAASDDEINNNSLAILARWLGESSYDGLADADRAGVKLAGEEPLYNLAMFGNYYSHHPYYPAELASLLDYAVPKVVWRRFACLSHGTRANELCNLEPEVWPDILNAADHN